VALPRYVSSRRAVALWFFRTKYAELDWRFGGFSVLAGCAVFGIWLGLDLMAGTQQTSTIASRAGLAALAGAHRLAGVSHRRRRDHCPHCGRTRISRIPDSTRKFHRFRIAQPPLLHLRRRPGVVGGFRLAAWRPMASRHAGGIDFCNDVPQAGQNWGRSGGPRYDQCLTGRVGIGEQQVYLW